MGLAYRGDRSVCPVSVRVGDMATCDMCRGSGQVTCKTCAGVGSYAAVPLGVEAMLAPCPKCNATGKTPCPTCKGSGQT